MATVIDDQRKGMDANVYKDRPNPSTNGTTPGGAALMSRIKDIAGQTRGDLRVIERVDSAPKSRLAIWAIHCAGCRGTFSARGSEWRRGAVSCGWCRAADRELVSHPADKSRSFRDPAAGTSSSVAGILTQATVTP